MPKPPHNQRRNRPAVAPPPEPQVTSQVSVEARAWSGPLPAPESLARYNEVIPGGAERVVAMAEKEQDHRIRYEDAGLRASIFEAKLGKYLGAGISGAAIVGSIVTALLDKPWQISVALVGIPILGIVQALVRSRDDK